MMAPRPADAQVAPGTVPGGFPASESFANPSGRLGTFNTAGQVDTANNAFFQSLGTNGRACVTCHQPADALGVSAVNAQARFVATSGRDPIFAPVDGATCPDAVTNPYSLLLNKGLIRVFLPFPPKAADGSSMTPEFTVEVLSDPTGCELNNVYGLTSPNPGISVYRRPLISTNLKFVTTAAPVDPNTNKAQPIDPFTHLPQSGNIMWDGREPTLHSQAVDATLGHAQAVNPPTPAQVQQIVDFENAIFSAQIYDANAHSLVAAGATGGPAFLSAQPPGQLSTNPFTEFIAWTGLAPGSEAFDARQSVVRGEGIFNQRSFTISNVAGFNELVGNNAAGTCSTCHNVAHAGTDFLPNAQRDLGVAGNSSAAIPSPDLPLFRLTCTTGSTSFNGPIVVVRDPGQALLTGKCADIGKIKVPQLRGLAAHAPFFHDGSAQDLASVVNFYNSRFNINFTSQEKQDLIQFLRTL
jgi:cytochrome c peroxidase